MALSQSAQVAQRRAAATGRRAGAVPARPAAGRCMDRVQSTAMRAGRAAGPCGPRSPTLASACGPRSRRAASRLVVRASQNKLVPDDRIPATVRPAVRGPEPSGPRL